MGISAVVLLLGLVTATTATAKQRVTKVKTTVTLVYQPAAGDYDEASFSGKVTAAKRVCEKNRRVSIFRVSRPQATIGRTRTNKNGFYVIGAGRSLAAGTYQVGVKQKTIRKKNGAKIICKMPRG